MLYIPSLRLWHSNSQRCNDGLQLYNPQNEGDGDFKTRGMFLRGFLSRWCSQQQRTRVRRTYEHRRLLEKE